MANTAKDNGEFEGESNGFFDEILSYITDLNLVVPALLAVVVAYIGYKYLESRKRLQESMMMIETEETNGGTAGESDLNGINITIEPSKEIEQYNSITKQLENNIKNYDEFLSSKKKKELTIPFKRSTLVHRCKNDIKIGIGHILTVRRASIKSRHESGKLSAEVLEAYKNMELAFNKELQDVDTLAKELDDPKIDPKDQPFHLIVWKSAKEEVEAERDKLLKEEQQRLEQEAKKKREKNKQKKQKQKNKVKAKKEEEKKIKEEEERIKVTEELLRENGLESLLEKDLSKETKENGL